jgi:hypothetical protein
MNEETLIEKLAIGLMFTLLLIGLALCPDVLGAAPW